MRSKRRRHITRKRLSQSTSSIGYDKLEEKQLLAVGTLFNGGNVIVMLTSPGDSAVVAVDNGNVTINGQTIDSDPIQNGVQAATVADIQSWSFLGSDGITDLAIELGGDFNDGSLDGVSFTNINHVNLTGNYITGTLNGTFLGNDGQFSGAGSMVVNGLTNLLSPAAFDFMFANAANDFVGGVSISTNGGDVAIRDANDLLLQNISSQNLTANAGGAIGDVAGGMIAVPGATILSANGDIDLGNNGNAVDLFAVISNTNGAFRLNELNSFFWSNFSTVQSAEIQAGGTVNMGPNANIMINGDAIFSATRIRLGVGGSNTFNADRINFNTTANAFIWENSSTVVFGINTAADLDIFSTGNITNADGASLTVAGISSFQTPGLVSIGNAAGDTFNTGRLEFFANQVNVTEDSNMLISGLANFAVNFVLQANGTINDTDNAFIVVQQNATLISATDNMMGSSGVVIGESANDFFTAGSVSFDVADGNFLLTENDGTVIASLNGFVNRAVAINIFSSGSLVNGNGADVQVATTAILAGTSISIGQAANDFIQFGSVTFNTDGDVLIGEDDEILLTGSSFVGGNLGLNANGSLTDSNMSFLTVAGRGLFVGTSITLGDLPAPTMQNPDGDILSTGSLRFFSTGDVDITHNGDVVLEGNATHLAVELVLTADADMAEVGNITNDPGVTVMVIGNMFLESGGDILLGANPTDVINFDNLNFSALGSMTITAMFANPASSFFIFGTSNNPNAADELRLVTNVDVLDGVNAVIMVDTFCRIEARNIVLGDTATDCVIVPAMAEFITTDMPPDVTTNAVCP